MKGVVGSFSEINAFSPPSESSDGDTKYLSGVAFSKFSFVGSFKNGNPSGSMSLKITLPIVVINNFLFCSSVNVGLLNDFAAIPTRVWRWIYPFWYAILASSASLNIIPSPTASGLSNVR